jgi:uncharacterized membrane protein YciS (DUF1049 family)
LILIGLAFFIIGLLLGWLSASPSLLRYKLENGRLKRELKTVKTPQPAPREQPPLM